MKKVTFKPKKDFTGGVELTLPSAKQRLYYIKECNFNFSDEGNLSVSNNIDAMTKMYEIAEKHIVNVTLKHENGTVFDSWEAMSNDSDCDEVCEGIIGIVLQGSLGEG